MMVRDDTNGRSRSRPDPFSGEFARKSPSGTRGLVRRSHSSTDTTTAVSRPLRVIVCGPCVRARSSTSLKRAFAAATFQAGCLVVIT